MTPLSKAEPFELNLRLDANEALNRIVQASDEQRWGLSFSGFQGTKAFLHRFDGTTLTIQKRRYYRNDFHPCLYSHFEPTSFGSKLTGHFAMNKSTRGFMLLWFGFVGFAVLAIAVTVSGKIATGHSRVSELLYIFHPVGMLLFGYALVSIGGWFSRKEKQQIAEWLNRLFADSIYVTTQPSIWRE